MLKLILVHGLPATGKSTSSKLLYSRSKMAASIEADALTNVQEFKTDEDVAGLKLENVACLVKNFIRAGCECIICDGVVVNAVELETLQHLLHPHKFKYIVFELVARVSVREDRWLSGDSRPLSQVDKEREVCPIPNSSSVKVCTIDTTLLNPELVVEKMVSFLNR